MKTGHLAALLGLLLPLGCTRTVVVREGPRPVPPPAAPPAAPPVRSTEPRWVPERPPATAATLGIPAGHLPQPGECRIWIPRVPPGRQRSERSRSCVGITRVAPAGTWIVYRPTRDRRLVHVRLMDERRPGIITVVHVFDYDTGDFLREEEPSLAAREDRDERDDRDWRDRRDERDRRDDDRRDDRDRRDTPEPVSRPAPTQPAPVPAPTADPRRTPEQRPPEERPRPADQQPRPFEPPIGPIRPTKPTFDSQPAPRTPAPAPAPAPPTPTPAPPPGPVGEPRRGPPAPATPTAHGPLDIPPGHLPQPGECRIWIPGTPPGRQPHRASSDCAGIGRTAPAGSWVVYRPGADRKVVHVRIVDARRPGVVVIVRVFDAVTLGFLREEQP